MPVVFLHGDSSKVCIDVEDLVKDRIGIRARIGINAPFFRLLRLHWKTLRLLLNGGLMVLAFENQFLIGVGKYRKIHLVVVGSNIDGRFGVVALVVSKEFGHLAVVIVIVQDQVGFVELDKGFVDIACIETSGQAADFMLQTKNGPHDKHTSKDGRSVQ